MVRKNDTIGIWVMESEKKDKVSMEKDFFRAAQFIALFVQLRQNERIRTYNLYLEPMTNLPGRAYFKQVVERLKDCGHKVILCVIRYEGSRESIRIQEKERERPLASLFVKEKKEETKEAMAHQSNAQHWDEEADILELLGKRGIL